MNRREIAEENYRRKFDEFGLSDSFTFVRREWSTNHGKRFWCVCKSCGSEFLSYDEVLRSKQAKRLICPQCGARSDGGVMWARSPKCDEAMNYYVQGHSIKETAELFGVPKYQISKVATKRGLSNSKNFRESANEKNKQRSLEAEKRFVDTLAAKGFAYIGGYDDKNSSLQMQCDICGAVFTRTADFIRRGKLTCPQCEREKKAALAEEKRKQKEEQQREQELERQKAKEEKADARFHELNDKVHVCIVCGKHFSKTEFMESKGRKEIPTNPKYCSKECEKRYRHRQNKLCPSKKNEKTDNHRHRARKYGCEYDSSVNLKRLIERDGLRCAICGEMCDLNDHSWSQYSGPLYPSIDHIIPMSKGGGHTWDNVQIAHIICNSEKGDRLEAV